MKAILFGWLCFASLAAAGQTSFSQRIKSSAYISYNNRRISKSEWPQVLVPPGKLSTQQPDSLEAFLPKDGSWFGPKGGAGFRISLQRVLPVLKPGRRELVWSTGLGYRNAKEASPNFSTPYGYSVDTTKTYRLESVNFSLRQTNLDVYNALTYNVWSLPNRGFFIAVGVAVQASIPLSSKVHEQYTTSLRTWNTATRRWQESAGASTSNSLPARKQTVLSFSLPFEVGFRCSKRLTLSFNADYFRNYHLPVLFPREKTSDVTLLGFSLIQTLP